MGAQADVAVVRRAIGPFALWAGILAGPLAWAMNLTAAYAVVKWACGARTSTVFHLITLAALTIVCAGAVLSWRALQTTAGDEPTDGGQPRQRARFMAILGLTTCALFALQIVAGAIPYWVLDACQ